MLDLVQGFTVITTAIIIFLNPKMNYADNICSILISLIIFFSSISITKKCIMIFMEATPEKYKLDEVEGYLMKKVKISFKFSLARLLIYMTFTSGP
jgi:Co/Zn/Cd efflux system component